MALGTLFKDYETLEEATKILLDRFPTENKISIWDAGCGLGAEPLTLAIILCEKLNENAKINFEIIATDIDECNIIHRLLLEGIVHKSDLKLVPKKVLDKHFIKTKDKDYFIITQNITNTIHFYRHNLLNFKLIKKGFHFILCKNVLIHIEETKRKKILQMFYSGLLPNGILALNNSEIMQNSYEEKFQKISRKENIFQKKI